ncbi:MAG: hypothetical protein ABS35_12805 [Kaistia sp. SCN 65-12]|nr:MAG: hypothetical protein ABS35_12805 [Kaistia sp. SCN 65-12]
MEREDLDELAQDLLGRPLTAAEYRDLRQAVTALRLGPGSPVLILLILYGSLRSEVSAAMAVATAWSVEARGRKRMGRLALGLGLCIAGAGLGYTTAEHRLLQDLDSNVRWALSEDGKRARRLSDLGLLKHLDDCSIPGWSRQNETCFPGPDPATGDIRGIRIGP